jgi:zinc/manganese transport system substrate-binding protein
VHKQEEPTMNIVNNALIYMVLLLVIIHASTAIAINISNSMEKGLYIVVSFPNLVADVKQLICKNDVVISIAPQGVDPHTYSLTPKNIDDLRRADIIVSTAHTPFEEKIEELWRNGDIKGVLIEIPHIPGIIIRENPVTGNPDYHMPIYDPYNYIVFIKYLTQVMISKNPSCKTIYLHKMEKVIDKVTSIIMNTTQLNIKAVADTPATIYAVSWLGIDVKYLIVKEHGVQATPEDILRIENSIRSGAIGLAVVTYPPVSSPSQKLLDIANKYNLPILYVPSPISNKSFIDKLEFISREVSNLNTSIQKIWMGGRERVISKSSVWNVNDYILLSTGLFIFILTSIIIYRGRRS